ncbi:MAG: hypothetical protein ACRDT2_21655, partial [Natronosporangium sp.]
ARAAGRLDDHTADRHRAVTGALGLPVGSVPLPSPPHAPSSVTRTALNAVTAMTAMLRVRIPIRRDRRRAGSPGRAAGGYS